MDLTAPETYSEVESTRVFAWTSDDDVTDCTHCGALFNNINCTKHHCRRCGNIFCTNCSSHKMLIPRGQSLLKPDRVLQSVFMREEEIITAPQRVCRGCSSVLVSIQDDLKRTLSPSYNHIIQTGSIFSVPALNFKLEDEVMKAMALMELKQNSLSDGSKFTSISECYGLVFITLIKAGFIFTGKYGTGFVVARLSDTTWSCPSAVTLAGVGCGLQVGAEIQHVCFLLPNKSTVDAFKSRGQFSLGGEVSLSFLVGMSVEAEVSAGNKGMGHTHGVGVTQGIFLGTSIEASVMGVRKEVNSAFYGESISASDLLSGKYVVPPAVAGLHNLLKTFVGVPEHPFQL